MDLTAEINAIKIIDHHAHIMDPFYWNDALGEPPPFPPHIHGLDIPKPDTSLGKTSRLIPMFQQLYGFPCSEVTEENKAKLQEAYAASKADEPALYHRVMDLAGIEMIGELGLSRPILPPGLDPKRFRVVAFTDGLIIPLDNSALKKPMKKSENFIRLAEISTENLKKDLDWHPTTFDDYMQFLRAVAERLKALGCIAAKSSCGYWRGLDFELVDEAEARDIFDAKDNSPVRYKRLQDFLQIRFLEECGRVGLVFQMHTGAGGQEGFLRKNKYVHLLAHRSRGCPRWLFRVDDQEREVRVCETARSRTRAVELLPGVSPAGALASRRGDTARLAICGSARGQRRVMTKRGSPENA